MKDEPNWPLKLAIWQSGLTQIRIARQIGRSDSWLSRLVSGLGGASPEDRGALAEALGKPVQELFPHAETHPEIKS